MIRSRYESELLAYLPTPLSEASVQETWTTQKRTVKVSFDPLHFVVFNVLPWCITAYILGGERLCDLAGYLFLSDQYLDARGGRSSNGTSHNFNAELPGKTLFPNRRFRWIKRLFSSLSTFTNFDHLVPSGMSSPQVSHTQFQKYLHTTQPRSQLSGNQPRSLDGRTVRPRVLYY